MRSIPSRAEPLLRTALARPIIMGRLTPQEWDLLLRQARASALMSRIANLIDEHGLREAVPAEAWRHLDGERRFAARLAHDVQIEIGRIAEPLLRAGIEVVLLKGAAYIVGDLPPAQGRDFSDIDIMVPRADIETAELSLRLEGWRSKELDRWDERFYRAWMHELPPLVHAVRDSVVDLHHTIVPLMAAIRPDARLLFEAARPGTTDPSVKVLGPPDMVLHSATHLFNEGEFGRALRDLVDLDLLFRHFGRDAGFWSAFLARAARLNLGRPAYYALRCTVRFLGTPIPAEILQQSRRFAPLMPNVMERLFDLALRPPHPSCLDLPTRLALTLLYIRAHHLRLPLWLLIPHLLRKMWKRGVKPDRLDPDPRGVNP